jgi:hypothetical protein
MAALRALLRVHGLAFVASAVPMLVGVLLVSAIVLGPNGLDPRDVVRAMHHDRITHLAIVAAWLALARPPSQAQLLPPGSTWTRSAPIARASHLAVVLAFSCAIHLPITALMWRGGGPAEGIAMLLLCIALGTLSRHRASILAATVALAARLTAVPIVIQLIVGATATAIALFIGFRDAPLRTRAAMRLRLRLPPFPSLVLAHLRVLLRDEGPRVTRTILLGLLVAGFAVMQVRGQAGTDVSSRVIVTAAFTSMIAIGTLARSIGRTRRRLAPLVAASGRSPRGPFVASAAVLSGPPMLVGVALAALLRRYAAVALDRALGFALLAVAVSITLVTIAARLEDRLAARRRDDATRWVLVSLALGIGGSLCALSPPTLLPLAGVVGLVAVLAAVLARDAEVPLARG